MATSLPPLKNDTSGSRPKILLLGEIEYAHATWEEIGKIADILTPKSTKRDDFIAECRSGAFDGVKVILRTPDSTSITGLIDADLIPVLPPSVGFICNNSAGYDQTDVRACIDARTAIGLPPILVSNVPTAVDDATADTALFLMLGVLRAFWPAMKMLQASKWRGAPGELPLGHDPRGMVLGVLGLGGIGRNLALKARALGMRIRYHNRNRLADDVEKEVGAEYVDRDTLLRESDVLSLHIPSNPETNHSISTAEFAKMKHGIYIINTARGRIMDEKALVAALEAGTVAGAGLDVFEHEPYIEPSLITNDRVLLLPHSGTQTFETQRKMEVWVMDNVRMALETGKLKSLVPEHVKAGLG